MLAVDMCDHLLNNEHGQRCLNLTPIYPLLVNQVVHINAFVEELAGKMFVPREHVRGTSMHHAAQSTTRTAKLSTTESNTTGINPTAHASPAPLKNT